MDSKQCIAKVGFQTFKKLLRPSLYVSLADPLFFVRSFVAFVAFNALEPLQCCSVVCRYGVSTYLSVSDLLLLLLLLLLRR